MRKKRGKSNGEVFRLSKRQRGGLSKMKRFFTGILVSAFLFSYVPKGFAATDEEIQVLKTQVQELLERIEKLEAEQTQSKTEAVKAREEVAKLKETQALRVDLANTLSKLKMKGRFAAGYFDSGKAGSFPAGSFEMPDAKIQFAFQPDDINTIVLRFKLDNAVTSISSTSPLLDYLYLQSKDFLPQLKGTPFSLSGRLGRFKLGFGEETWSDNPIEGILPSNSAAKAGVSDEGLELAGKIKLDKITIADYTLRPLGWVVSVSDGNAGVGSDSSANKAFLGKIYYTPIDPLYLSASYYDSGDLGTQNTEMAIGGSGLSSRPAGANNWQRSVWEADARYDFKKGKKPLDPPAFSDSKAILRLSYGEFQDSSVTDRYGNFGFVDGICNLTRKFYAAGRYSFVNLDGDITATLNSVTANIYERYSLGGGYRWSENTIVKLSYDWNKNSGPGVDDADDNLLSVLVATQF